ncbi:MAG: YgfZ/GcvT domain-containing protein [Acidimicrobiales bacterium]
MTAPTLDLAATLAALDAGGPLALVDERDVIVVSGPDAVTYLQGQISQNVAALAVGASADSLVLDPQGKVDGWFRLTRLADDTIALDTEAGLGERIETRLRRFWLRVDATLTLSTWKRATLVGAGEPMAPDGGFAVRAADVTEVLGPELAVPVDGAADAPVGDPAAVETLRIRAARPRIDLDATDRTIPAELGVVDQSADFTKGCYVGQELVARVDSRGNNTPRRLVVCTAAEAVAAGAAITTSAGDEAGHVTSVAPEADGVRLFASIKRGVEPADGLTADGVALTPAD